MKSVVRVTDLAYTLRVHFMHFIQITQKICVLLWCSRDNLVGETCLQASLTKGEITLGTEARVSQHGTAYGRHFMYVSVCMCVCVVFCSPFPNKLGCRGL